MSAVALAVAAVPRVSALGALGVAAEVSRLSQYEPDDDSLDAKRDGFAARLNDSPAWALYFAGVGHHFDHGAARARRHPRKDA